MNLNNFTIKAQETIQHAFQIAQGNNQQSVETGHILKGLLHSAENVIEFLLKKLGVSYPVCDTKFGLREGARFVHLHPIPPLALFALRSLFLFLSHFENNFPIRENL